MQETLCLSKHTRVSFCGVQAVDNPRQGRAVQLSGKPMAWKAPKANVHLYGARPGKAR